MPPEIDDPIAYLTENRMAVIGTPDDMIEHIELLQEGSGGFGAFLELAHNWADFPATRRHFELVQRYVMPHFHDSNALRRESYDYSHENRELFVGTAAEAIAAEIAKEEARKAAAE